MDEDGGRLQVLIHWESGEHAKVSSVFAQWPILKEPGGCLTRIRSIPNRWRLTAGNGVARGLNRQVTKCQLRPKTTRHFLFPLFIQKKKLPISFWTNTYYTIKCLSQPIMNMTWIDFYFFLFGLILHYHGAQCWWWLLHPDDWRGPCTEHQQPHWREPNFHWTPSSAPQKTPC